MAEDPSAKNVVKSYLYLELADSGTATICLTNALPRWISIIFTVPEVNVFVVAWKTERIRSWKVWSSSKCCIIRPLDFAVFLFICLAWVLNWE
jgi:hypothetical protein